MDPKILELFAIHAPVLDLVLRGAAIYLLLFALFHFVLRAQAVSFGIVEMMVLVLVADASQSAMAGEAISLTESAILAGAVLASHLLVRIAYAFRHRVRMARRLQDRG